jgi:hypothetical protein
MNFLLAHHVEAQHVPVLLAMLLAGFWIGWNLVSRIARLFEKK